MLPPEYLINRVEPITLMYSDLHTSILEAIARHIADTLRATGEAGLMPSAVYQDERLQTAGLLREEIIERIAKINRMSRKEIRQIFKDAAVKTQVYDDRIYKAAGLEPIPVMQSPEMLRILDAGISKTLGSVERLTGTIATNAQERFEELLNLGYNKVASGALSYNDAIVDAVDDLAREGVTMFTYASGRQISVEAAVRMNVLTGANQTAAEITKQSMIDMGISLARTSAHIGARNIGEEPENHEKWQGKVFRWRELEQQIPVEKRVGFTNQYPDFIKSTGYMITAKGLAGPNCRHSFGSYIEGLSPETYSEAELDEFANATVTYNGEEIPYYKATQEQRRLERGVREWLKRQKVKEAAGVDATIEKRKIKEWRLRVKNFTEQTGLKRDWNRERVAEQRK